MGHPMPFLSSLCPKTNHIKRHHWGLLDLRLLTSPYQIILFVPLSWLATTVTPPYSLVHRGCLSGFPRSLE
jgi:hypothetical protein